MKSKKNTYLLLSVAVIVWGIVIYKFITAQKGPEIYNSIKIENQKQKAIVKDNNFDLVLDYPSPFQLTPTNSSTNQRSLTHSSYRPAVKKSRQSTSLSQKEATKQKDEKKIVWPEIEYVGLADKSNNHNQTILIKIDGELNMVKRNKNNLSFQIISASTDSLKINNNGEIRTYFSD